MRHRPASIIATTITYLENNQKRMHYPEYRRQGLPVTTAWMESLVKEVNYRERDGDVLERPRGAEAILQCGCRPVRRRTPDQTST